MTGNIKDGARVKCSAAKVLSSESKEQMSERGIYGE
jgi:hypothetical protein